MKRQTIQCGELGLALPVPCEVFTDFSVLASGRSELDSLIQESLLIARINHSLNVNIRSFPLMLFGIFFLFFSPSP